MRVSLLLEMCRVYFLIFTVTEVNVCKHSGQLLKSQGWENNMECDATKNANDELQKQLSRALVFFPHSGPVLPRGAQQQQTRLNTTPVGG